MLVFRCRACGAQLKLKDEFANQKVRCPSCQAVITAPGHSDPEGTGVTAAPAKRRAPGARPNTERDDAAVSPATSGKALASLLLSIGNCLCLPFILSLPSLILGILAFVDISRRPEQLKGKGLALTGILLSIFGNLAYAVLLVAVIVAGPAVIMTAVVGGAGQKIQQAATKTQTLNNLKEVALAMHSYNDDKKRLFAAPGWDTPNNPNNVGAQNLSWRVAMLPYMGQAPLFHQFNPKVPWDQAPNSNLQGMRPPMYASPTNPALDPKQTFLQVCTGPNTLFRDVHSPPRIPASIPDGLSNTIFCLEATSGPVIWTRPADIAMTPPGQPLPPGLQGGGSLFVAMCDGSVRALNRTKISDQVMRLLIDPADGQVLPAGWDAP
jgi:hypothetical protein